MKILVCWSNITGYWGACWRALGRRKGVDLSVLAFAPPDSVKYDKEYYSEYECRLLSKEERKDEQHVHELAAGINPDVMLFVGWFVKPYRSLANSSKFKSIKKFMSVDTQWKREVQYLTRLRYWRYFRSLDGAGVSGERSWQYVRRLGFSAQSISRCMYGVDEELWNPVYEKRNKNEWPKQFLFVGRYVREKAMDVLTEAYEKYRQSVENPWPLVCCGSGPEGKWLDGATGITDMGYMQPADMAEMYMKSGVFVMSSRSDEWPLSLVEAAMSGLPILASEACGSAVEIVRPLYNGLVVPQEDAEALSEALQFCHEAPLRRWGDRAREHAMAFTADCWADRWLSAFTRSMK